MKQLYMIGGTMGIGKTSVSLQIKGDLPNAVFLDGDWCWDSNPFQVTDETKNMVIDNIAYLLNNFIRCSAYDNIIFCWVLHEQAIIDAILSKLDLLDCKVKNISLLVDENCLTKRIMADVKNGVRQVDVLDRSLVRLPLYDLLNTIKIDTTGKSVQTIAKEIESL
jgi:hypothetical protein